MAKQQRTDYERILWMNNWVSMTMIIVGAIAMVMSPLSTFVPPATAILVGLLRQFVKPKMGKFFVPVGTYVGVIELIAAPIVTMTSGGYNPYAWVLWLTGGSMLAVSLLRMLMVNIVTYSTEARKAQAALLRTAKPVIESDAI